MAPFIKCTHVTQTQSGEKKTTEFINAACISSATYDDDTKELVLVLAPATAPYKKGDTKTLKGDEALIAMRAIEKLT